MFVQSTVSLKIKTKFSRGEENNHMTGMWSPYEAVYASAMDSLGRVLVVPFQKVSLKGILVMLWPSFSAFSVSRKKGNDGHEPSNLHVNINDLSGVIPLRISRR